MDNFLNLQRKFRELSVKELTDLDDGAFWSRWFEEKSALDWSVILQWPRVVLLAEAGSGKTAEMKAQVRQLRDEQKYAFFLPLEALVRGSVLEALSIADGEKFNRWQHDSDHVAWFFLDSVDELKLNDASALKTALRKFVRAIDGSLARSHVVISSRPSDWRVHTDARLFEELLPSSHRTEENEKNGSNIHVVTLWEMQPTQVELFAQYLGVHSAQDFLAEIERQDAWVFAHRPLDLSGLINIWNQSGRLGTRVEQHNANIALKLRDDPDRADQNDLSDDEARHGVEQLALALVLTRTRTIRSPEVTMQPESMDGALNPEEILSNWAPRQRQSLLRRALFDPATYGRIRFHHRSVQEFLAAQQLRTLSAKGMSNKSLMKLLFAESYGEKIVIPSMRAVATWLALWNDSVCKELMTREPEALLNGGDPESLTLAVRKKLLATLVEKYGQGGWRGLKMTVNEKRRIAHRDLAPTIRELWGKKSTNPEVNQLLIDLIGKGEISECADLIQLVAIDPQWKDTQRVAAVRALISCGCKDTVFGIVDKILSDGNEYSNELAAELLINLVPEFITIDKLRSLIERSKPTHDSLGGFADALERIAHTLDVSSLYANELRDQLAKLIEQGLDITSEFYSLRSQFSDLAPTLAILCARQLSLCNAHENASLIRAGVIAARFTDQQSANTSSLIKLRSMLDKNFALREAVFWAELDFMDQYFPNEDAHMRLCNVDNYGLTQKLVDFDLTWLRRALADEHESTCRVVALYASVEILKQQRTLPTEIKSQLFPLLKGNHLLEKILEKFTQPYLPSVAELELREDNERRSVDQNRRQDEMRQKWEVWFVQLLADPDAAFLPTNALTTIFNIFTYLDWWRRFKGEPKTSTVSSSYNLSEIPPVFGDNIAQRTVAYLKTLWRSNSLSPWSARKSEDRHRIDNLFVLALRGLEAETLERELVPSLSEAEARIAAIYAMSLEAFITTPIVNYLMKFHQQVVGICWGEELSKQLEIRGEGYLPILQILESLRYDSSLKELLAPRLVKFLATLPIPTQGDEFIHRLDSIFQIFDDSCLSEYHQEIAAICVRQYEKAPNSPLFLIWLRGVFCFNPEQAVNLLVNDLTETDEFTCDKAIKIFAGLFSRRRAYRDGNMLNIVHPERRIAALEELIRLAYTYISPEQDQIHEARVAYSPNQRDEAEYARSYLLNILFESSGIEAYQLLLKLAKEFNSSPFADRLRQIAYQRAATDAELSTLCANDVRHILSCNENPPHDRDGLFRAMMDRLEDLAHDIAHHDFTDRTTLCKIDLETEMRNTLALRLQRNDLYKIACESIVADEKRTDFSLYALDGNQKVVIELKLAHKWTIKQLEQALDAQLVGQYLRHENCKAGCLLITDRGSQQNWQHPETRKMLTFYELIKHLQEKAIELERQHSIKLAVFGLSFIAPYLAPAHGKVSTY